MSYPYLYFQAQVGRADDVFEKAKSLGLTLGKYRQASGYRVNRGCYSPRKDIAHFEGTSSALRALKEYAEGRGYAPLLVAHP